MLGFHPLASRPLGDVVAEIRLAAVAVTEADDTLAATAALAIAAVAAITEVDDALTATATLQMAAQASITEADDTLTAVAALSQPTQSPGQRVRKRRGRAPVFLPFAPMLAQLRAQLHVTEDDDTLTAHLVMAEAPAARRRRQALNFLLMQ